MSRRKKAKRRCPACGVEEKETALGYTNLAPYSGYCVGCINRAADAMDKADAVRRAQQMPCLTVRRKGRV